MSTRINRRILLGTALLAISILVQVVPGSLLVPLEEAFGWVRGQGTTVTFFVGTIIVVAGLLSAIRRTPARRSNRDRSLDPRGAIPQNEPAVDRLIGADIDDRLEVLATDHERVSPRVKTQLKAELRDVAVRHVQETTDCSREEANRRVDDGSWHSAQSVTAFLATDATFPVWIRVVDWLSTESAFRRRMRRVVDAVAPPTGGDTQ